MQNIKNLALLSLVIVLWNPILESYEYWDTANDIDEKEKLSPKEEGALELVNQETNQETLVVLKGIVHKMENTPTPEKISSQQEDYREGLLLTLKEIKSTIEKNPDSKESTK